MRKLLNAWWGVALWVCIAPGWAQDRALEGASKIDEGDRLPRYSWRLDFRWPWPDEKADFRDVYSAQGTDALAYGYYLDERSISPKGFYGVIVPRFGGGLGGRNFLVELEKRRIVGVLEGPGLVFPAKAQVSWSYRWAPDGTGFAVEQAHAGEKGWSRDGLRFVELKDDQIVRQTDLLKEPRKTPSWFDVAQPPGETRSFPAPLKYPQVLAISSENEKGWKIERESASGPLSILRGNEKLGTLPAAPMRFVDGAGKIQEGSSDENPNLPLCFFSSDEKWLFVNQIVREDPETGVLNRTGVIYRRKDGEGGNSATWDKVTPKRLDELAWQLFAAEEKISDERIGPPDTTGWSDRTIEFVAWSQDSGRLLVELRAGNGAGEKGGVYRWFCYFNTKTLACETDGDLSSTNEELRPKWTSRDESLIERRVPLRAADIAQTSFFAPPSEIMSFADSTINASYQALLARTQPGEVERVRKEQRAWLKYRETLAWVHVAQRWTRFPEIVLAEGRYLATRVRADELRRGAIKAHPGPNTVIRDKSPDGKFGILYTYAEEDVAHEGRIEGLELLELSTKRVVLDLYDESANRSLAVLWAPDSQHLAYHYASRRVGEFTIYARKGADFVALKNPEYGRYSPKMGKGEQEGHFNGADNEPIRWLGPKRLLFGFSMDFDVETDRGGGRPAQAYYDIVVAIDSKGKVVIEKATKKKPPE